MTRKKQEIMDFRYYDMPPQEPILVLAGDSWKRNYGNDAPHVHFHNILEIGYCHYGMGRMIYEKEVKPFQGGAISVIPRNIPHNTMSDGDTISYWEFLFVNVEQLLADYHKNDYIAAAKLTDCVNIRYHLFQEKNAPQAAFFIKEVIHAYQEKKPYYKEYAKGIIYSFLMMIAGMNREYDILQAEERERNSRNIRKALEYIQKSYGEILQIADLADICHMSETHFRRIFVQDMKMTPIEYLNMVRVQKACDLLYKTDYAMDVIADKVGYQTCSTFNRNFKRFTGLSPFQWKKNMESRSGKVIEYNITAYKGWE